MLLVLDLLRSAVVVRDAPVVTGAAS